MPQFSVVRCFIYSNYGAAKFVRYFVLITVSHGSEDCGSYGTNCEHRLNLCSIGQVARSLCFLNRNFSALILFVQRIKYYHLPVVV